MNEARFFFRKCRIHIRIPFFEATTCYKKPCQNFQILAPGLLSQLAVRGLQDTTWRRRARHVVRATECQTACTQDGESTSGTRARDQTKRTNGRECGRSRACDGSSAKPSRAQARVNEGPSLRRPLPNAHTNERNRGVGALSTCRARARTTTHTIHERHLESAQTLQRTSAAQTRYDTRLDIARARTQTRKIEA